MKAGQPTTLSQIPSPSRPSGLVSTREWKKTRPEPEETGEEVEDSDDVATGTLEEAEERAWSEIRSYLGRMPPYDFPEPGRSVAPKRWATTSSG